MTWLRDEKRADRKTSLGLAVRASLNPGLREEIVATAKAQSYSEDGAAI